MKTAWSASNYSVINILLYFKYSVLSFLYVLNLTKLEGTLHYKQGNVEKSLHHLRYAIKLEESLPSYSATIAANFVEILRATGDAEGARNLGYNRLRSTRYINSFLNVRNNIRYLTSKSLTYYN